MDVMLRKIAIGFFLLGLASMIYWPKVYRAGLFIPFRYDLAFLIAVCVFSFYFLNQTIKEKITFLKKDRDLYSALGILSVSILGATAISFFRYGFEFNVVGVSLFLKILLGIGTFVSIKFILDTERSNTLHRWLILAFSVPSLILIPILFFPAFAGRHGMISLGYRFMGLTANPVAMDLIVMTAFSCFYTFLMAELMGSRRWLRLFFYVLAILGLSAIVFWSQSRYFIFSMFMVQGVSACIYYFYVKENGWKILGCLFLGSFLISSSFFFIPLKAQKLFFYGRIMGIDDELIVGKEKDRMSKMSPEIHIQSSPVLVPMANENNPKNATEQMFSVLKSDTRFKIWISVLPIFIKNPLGLGLNYEAQFPQLTPTFLINIWALGGIFAVFSICYFLWRVFLKSFHGLSKTDFFPYQAGMYSAFLVVLLSSFFYGLPIDYIGFWVLSAFLVCHQKDA